MKQLTPHVLGIRAVGLACAYSVTLPAQAQQYGPRKFIPPPKDTNVFSSQILHTDSNSVLGGDIVYSDLDIQSTALVASYTRLFGIGDFLGTVVVTQPFAFADVSVDASAAGFANEVNHENSGLADTLVEFRDGIINAPALTLEEYGANYFGPDNPDVVMQGMVQVSLPTGDYSSSRVVNLSTNRFRFRAALPTMINFGPNWASGNRTILELNPQLDFYTDNTDPFSLDLTSGQEFGSEFISQAPIFRL